MKRLLLSLPSLLLGAIVAGCSRDIKVTSDVGEVSLVKDSSVSTYQFDLLNANKFSNKWLASWKKDLDRCLDSMYLDASYCNESYGKYIREQEENIELLKAMPDITIVEYRTIDTNVNGDKIASGYKYVSCIPDGEPDKRVKWAKLVAKIDGIEAKPQKEIENNLLDDGRVVSSVQIKVCEKYGNL